MTKLLFWISVAFPLYVYIGFPLLLWLLQALVRRAPRKQPIEPSVSLLVAAYNEAAVIADKIRNSLALDYPAEKLEIVVASDGSEDATAEIVRSFEAENGGRVRLLNFRESRQDGRSERRDPGITRRHRGLLRRFQHAGRRLASHPGPELQRSPCRRGQRRLPPVEEGSGPTRIAGRYLLEV